MKNKFLLLILGGAFFCACSDDDKDDMPSTYNGSNLVLSVSDVALSGKEAVFNEESLTLKNAIPGEETTVFVLTKVGEEIQGTNVNDNRELTLKGTRSKDKLVLNVQMKVSSTLVGRWDVKALKYPLLLNLTTEKEKVVFGTSNIPSDNLFTPNEFVGTMKVIMFGPMLANALEYIMLEEDGNITASYADDVMKPTSYTQSPKGLVLYNVIGDKIYIGLNLAGLVADAQAKSDYNPLDQAMKMLDEGLPLLYKVEGEKLSVYMTKDMMLPFLDLVPMLGGVLPDEFKKYGPLLSQIATIIKESNTCELGLMMQANK